MKNFTYQLTNEFSGFCASIYFIMKTAVWLISPEYEALVSYKTFLLLLPTHLSKIQVDLSKIQWNLSFPTSYLVRYSIVHFMIDRIYHLQIFLPHDLVVLCGLRG